VPRPLRLVPPLAALTLLVAASAAHARIPTPRDEHLLVRRFTIHYVAHNGARRAAVVLAPAIRNAGDSPLPLVISPHGRGVDAWQNARIWGDLPGRFDFVVVSPDGEGRRLGLYSWGYRGQIDDLARMPQIVRAALPQLHIDEQRIYAFGGSMGGQEALLLLAQHPGLLAGVAAFDAPTNMAARYRDFARQPFGPHLRALAREEIGGTPAHYPAAYASRSPAHYAEQLAFSGVPLQLWWSSRDRVIRDQTSESGALYRRIEALNPAAPVQQCKGMWRHTVEMNWDRRLPAALRHFGLAPRGLRTTGTAARLARSRAHSRPPSHGPRALERPL
jgi:poly(3-hydroxybutyrate) depolymerase